MWIDMRNTADFDPADTESTEMELPVLGLKEEDMSVSKCKRMYHDFFMNALGIL